MKIKEETIVKMTAPKPSLITTCVDGSVYLEARKKLMHQGISVGEAIQFMCMKAAREGNVNFLCKGLDGYAF